MLIDGKAIAGDILAEVQNATVAFPRTPLLSAVTSAPNFETRKYLEMKSNKAAAVGIALNLVELSATVSTEEAVDCVTQVAKRSDGVVVQLPFPAQVDRDQLLAAIPVDRDPDGFQYGNVPEACFPPVVGAIDEISKRHGIFWSAKQVVVLGEGVLVGLPAAAYAKEREAEVVVLTKETFNEDALRSADIVISGIGQSHFIQPEMIKEGVVVFYAGTSEDGGGLFGDADPAVADRAAFFTPVPGGIGPITIAYLLRNLVNLTC